jgi:hypothetical protein
VVGTGLNWLVKIWSAGAMLVIPISSDILQKSAYSIMIYMDDQFVETVSARPDIEFTSVGSQRFTCVRRASATS